MSISNVIKDFYWYLYSHFSLFRHIRHFILYVLHIHWYWYLIIILLAAIVVMWMIWHRRTIQRIIITIGLLSYTCALYASLVLSRPITSEHQLNLKFLWTLKHVLSGEYKYNTEIILNLLMLAPVGFLLPIIQRISLTRIACIGFLISMSIEVLQCVSRTGLAELDDVFYNTISVLIGFGLYKVFSKNDSFNKLKQKAKMEYNKDKH